MFAAPLRWDQSDWMFHGGTVAAIAVAHDFDSRVRSHFAPPGAAGVSGTDTGSLRDALPAASLVMGTWLVSEVTSDSYANTEAYTMVEAAGFSSITAEALKYAAGRERPDQTTDPNNWRDAGSSFPSLHATAAFAVGTVFAESGSDDYRWFRRVVGYGMASATAYLRVHGNQHWLSDTVAGAALGIASGRFDVTHRRSGAGACLERVVRALAGRRFDDDLQHDPGLMNLYGNLFESMLAWCEHSWLRRGPVYTLSELLALGLAVCR